ncbi:Guanine deaminase [Sinobacterium norvegicum]|uniref:Guanine deaminase n=1 Tax=Sinobacterium norvegicum TaxID=1641715 RepID=A0ABN8EGI2_9GAMM|nr:guanine deaminase [Sinobacterium norvegicum]CAH0991381.1 Guanine deaminase [Sinobacterium norvegicum]
MKPTKLTAVRGNILHFLADPSVHGEEAYQYVEDGILFCENGHIKKLAPAHEILGELPEDVEIEHYPGHLIVPGFIDTHVHYPQIGMIAAYGEQLLEWLETYTFPTERRFSDQVYAEQVAEVFLNELVSCGTTTALVFGTVHPQSVDAFFNKAEARNLRMICGKVLMDRNCPDYLRDSAESGYRESRDLIKRWHGKDRLQYAITPRFAPTSTPEQLGRAGDLLRENPGVYMHTHLSENKNEIAWVQELYPDSKNYLDVYDKYNLLGSRSVFAHGVHLCDDACQRLADTQSAIAHCPSSNLFLGSGLFPLQKLKELGVKMGFGTDVGAGTSFSMLQTMSDAYKIQQLQGSTLSAMQAFYRATLGSAEALDLHHTIGNFEYGKEADFVVLNPRSSTLLDFRVDRARNLEEQLFVLAMLGDDRTVSATYIMGEAQYKKQRCGDKHCNHNH